jgi:Na+/H+-dicarboxylate symporter
MKLYLKILLAMGTGGLFGLLAGDIAIHLKPIGTLFLNLIQMLVGLLVLFSITVGVTAIGDTKKLAKCVF